MTDSKLWVAARRLTSAFYSGSADNFLAIVDEVDSADGWKAVALALSADVASLAHQVHGSHSQQWLDQKIAQLLDRNEQQGDTR
jgi:hypothetical protein